MIKNTSSSSTKAHELEELKILFNKENYDLLEIKTKSLIQKYPNEPMLYNILGVSQSSRKMFKEAIVNFKKAIKLNPKLLDAYNNLGIALKNCGELLKSFNVFQDALKIDPNHFQSIFLLGSLLAQTKNFDKAKHLLQKIIEINLKKEEKEEFLKSVESVQAILNIAKKFI